MAQGIGLAGGFGAGGARDALVDLIEQRLTQQKFDELKRARAEEERQGRTSLQQRAVESATNADLARARMTQDERQFGERLGLDVKQLDEGTRRFDTNLGFQQEEAGRGQRNKDRDYERGVQEFDVTTGESGRHNRAMEGISRERVAGSGGGAKSPSSLDAVADMVLQNPDLLKDFTPTDRSKILGHIATNKEGGLPNKRAESMRTVLDSALSTIGRLKEPRGRGGAVGMKGPASLFGYLEKPMGGTAAADYTAHLDTLKSQLTLPRLELMRGLGQMSDREFRTLSESATALNRDMSEGEFMRELTRVESTLGAIQGRLGGASETMPNREESFVVEDPRRGGGRAPAGGGQQFDFDPKTGKLVPRR